MELTQIVLADRQVIERYAPGGFRITGVVWRGSVLVFPDLTQEWPVAEAALVTSASLQPVIEHGGVQILLLGLGRHMAPVSRELRGALRQAGIVIEPMDTGAACRTFNTLVSEDRRVAAALIPPSPEA
jgi:uncharacterized protein